MKTFKLFISSVLALTLIILFFITCSENDENLIINTSNKEDVKLNKEIDEKPDTSGKALDCNRRVIQVWEFEKYAPVAGKIIGISSSAFNSYEDLFDIYGFRGIMVNNDGERIAAQNAGFELNKMMAPITANSFGYFSYPSGDFGYYHLDEALERDYPVPINSVINIANDVYQNNSDAYLLLSSWNRVGSSYSWGYSTILNSTYNTQIICDQYYDQTVWCGNDQTAHWTAYKNYYGASKVKSFWIHLLIDGQQNDFSMLFDKATTLGISNLWLYIGNAGDDWCGDSEQINNTKYYNYLKGFCTEAWHRGWLRYYVRKYYYYYSCYEPNPCSNCIFPDNFYLEEIIKSNEVKELF